MGKPSCEELERHLTELEKALIEQSIDGIVILQDMNCKFANLAMAEVSGYNIEELEELSFLDIVVQEEKEKIEQIYQKLHLSNDKVPSTYETRIQCKNGMIKEVEISMSVIKYKGSIIDIVLVHDITNRKRLEGQLSQSEKLASIGQLISGVAHELNNPLAIILGYSELMKSVPYLKKKELKAQEKIIQAAKRCSAIVDNLLKFTRKSKLEKTSIKINDVVYNAVAMREYQFKVNNVIIDKDLSTLLPLTSGDSNQLQSVFLNLINNAYDAMYTENKKGKLIIKTYHNGNDIVLEFIDDGTGVHEEIQDKLFDPFFTTKGLGKGTGLGLSISHEIIEEHNGQLYLDKTYKKGAKFVVRLPVIKTIEEKIIEKRVEKLPNKVNILLIDDEPGILSLQKSILESDDYHIDSTDNGKEGFDLVEKNNYNYDLIMSDIKMPGEMDGEDLYWKIKMKDEELAKRIIFVTGDIEDEIKRFFKKNDILYIKKPFSIEDYIAIISEGMKRKNE